MGIYVINIQYQSQFGGMRWGLTQTGNIFSHFKHRQGGRFQGQLFLVTHLIQIQIKVLRQGKN